MSNERPEALLKSALEKIVYFEARGESLSSDLASARAQVEHLKADVAQAVQREIQLRSELAEMEVRLQRACAERDELSKLLQALRQERTTLIGHVLEAASIHGADQPQEGLFDLASFIAELRSEVLSMQRDGEGQTTKAEGEATKVTQHAQRLRDEGRLTVSQEELFQLSGHPEQKDPEETLFGFSVRELSAKDPSARIRAAERLKSLGQLASAPALARALHTEKDATVQVALLQSFSATAPASEETAAVVVPLLSSPSPEIRVAALKGLLALSPKEALPHLSAAMKDPDRAVRRRAALLALSLPKEDALLLGELSLKDTDADVRAIGLRVLSAAGGEKARALLQRALRDPEPKVKRAAAEGISRMVGEDVSRVADLPEGRLRREIRRISHLPERPFAPLVRQRAEQETRAQPQVHATGLTGSDGVVDTSETRRRRGARGAYEPVREQTPEPPTPYRDVDPTPEALVQSAQDRAQVPVAEGVAEALMTEIRCALRGKPLLELAHAARVTEETAADACELLVASGRVVRRGQKYFPA